MNPSLQDCVDMLRTNNDDIRYNAESALFSTCCHILTNPDNMKYRRVFLSDPVVLNQLLPAIGAIECLLEAGFVEDTDCFFLPRNASLKRIEALTDTLQRSLSYGSSKINDPFEQALSIAETQSERLFFVRALSQYQLVTSYEDPALQEKARSVIPLIELEIATMTRIRKIQKYIKLNSGNTEASSNEKLCAETDISVKNLFLLELMHWFKYKFFTWVDSPMCPECKCECVYEKTENSPDPKCLRVEYHRCNQCNQVVTFPRYSDPEILLKLRRGRCGEWANVFTLLCRSLGYDARLIWDETDHAWTEVYNITEWKWIHLDSCENVMDQPLMYEKGWRKKLSYVIAYSRDEVEDVTSRYTQNLPDVMQRRKLCSEGNLLRFMQTLNASHHSARRRNLSVRRALVYVNRLKQQEQEDDSYGGRTSGSHAWKLARGEITEESSSKSYTWNVSKYGKSFSLSYCIVTDTYSIKDHTGSESETKDGWLEGVYRVEGDVFRKVEDDWKIAYLARSPGQTEGKVQWCFEAKNPKLRIRSFKLRTKDKVFHEGNTSWKLESFRTKEKSGRSFVINDCSDYYTEDLNESQRLILTATVSGSSGEVAWQHAQLFRQSLNDEKESMMVHITMMDTESIA